MKKLIALIFFASLFRVGILTAQTTDKQPPITRSGQWVDKNNDGICDKYQSFKTNPKGSKFVDKNNDGICDNYQNPKTNVSCPNFVDKNNDGICDNFPTNAKNNICCGKGMRCGKGNGYGWRNH